MGMIERVANALESAECGYGMSLIRLVDGVSTYRLSYDDGETLELGSTSEVYEHVGNKRRATQARAAIEAMREPTEAMVDAYDNMDVWDDDSTEPTAQQAMSAMIDAALNEQVAG